jgi:long-chain fatty acid transport protein
MVQVHAETSPLSVLSEGYGLSVSSYNARERAMGEAGMASVNKSGPSLPNPSRTAWNEKTSFAATFDSDIDYLQDNQTSNRTTSFLLPAIAMNFQTRWPLNIGLFYRQLYHRNFSFTPMGTPNPFSVQSFDAEGGLYEVGGTLAYAPMNTLALSLGYHFILGRERTIESSVFNSSPQDPDLFNAVNLKGDTLSTRSNGGYPSASMTFRQKHFSLAASGALGTTLERTLRRTVTGLSTGLDSTTERDLPWSAALGGAFKIRPNQSIVADFAWESWETSAQTALNPAFRVGTGYEFQGLGGPYERYYRKVTYRSGLGFERLYLDQTDLYFLSVGTGLPLGRRGNLVDIALKYGHRGSLESSFWSEDFIKLSVTLTGVGVWGQPVRKRR